MKRAVLIVLDSVGIGGAGDAAEFGDAGADTFGHIAAACAEGRGDREGLRQGPLRLPNLDRLGLGRAAAASTGGPAPDLGYGGEPSGRLGLWRRSVSQRQGHAVGPLGDRRRCRCRFDWGYFPQTVPAFPARLTEALIREAGLPGILGNWHASGTRSSPSSARSMCGPASRSATPRPIRSFRSPRTRAHFGLERLYEFCKVARRLGRSAQHRPGDRAALRRARRAATFERTANRRDYAVPPPEPTLLDRLVAARRRVIGVGKIGDIFAHQGVTRSAQGGRQHGAVRQGAGRVDDAGDGDLVFANFVDFDMVFGHRRDVAGYAAALEAFDRRLPELQAKLKPGDLLILTADHGCDPDLARHRPHARARADARLRTGDRLGTDRPARLSPISARPSPRISASRRGGTDGAFFEGAWDGRGVSAADLVSCREAPRRAETPAPPIAYSLPGVPVSTASVASAWSCP